MVKVWWVWVVRKYFLWLREIFIGMLLSLLVRNVVIGFFSIFCLLLKLLLINGLMICMYDQGIFSV